MGKGRYMGFPTDPHPQPSRRCSQELGLGVVRPLASTLLPTHKGWPGVHREHACTRTTAQRRAHHPQRHLLTSPCIQLCTRTRTDRLPRAHTRTYTHPSVRRHVHHTHAHAHSCTHSRTKPKCRVPGLEASRRPAPAAGRAARAPADTRTLPARLHAPGRGPRAVLCGAARRAAGGGGGGGRESGGGGAGSRQPAGPRSSCRPGIFQPER